ncbi:MAG: ribonuclease Z [Pseudomonadota bacterium]
MKRLQLILLGTGTGIPIGDRASPSLLALMDSHPILFDLGPGTLRQLSKAGVSHHRIHQVFISHLHPDHTADLIHFLFATRHPPILENREPFSITGPLGFREFLKKLQRAYGKWLDIPSEIMSIEELDTGKPEKRVYPLFTVTSQPLKHTPQSLGYRVEGPSGKRFVYSGDTGFCDGIVYLAEGADLLLLECSFPDGEEVEGHLTPSLAGRIATLAKVKKLLLLHFYPETLTANIARECRKTYSGELILGRDLMHISL